MPDEMIKESDAAKDFSLESFEEAIITLPEVKPQEPAPSVDVKPEVKSDTPEPQKQNVEPLQVEEKKVIEPEAQPKAEEIEKENEKIIEEVSKDIRTSKKDFTDIAQEDIPFFSKMSLSAFNRLKPVYLEHKKQTEQIKNQEAELTKLRSGALPDSYFEHPLGYTLTNDFKNTAALFTKAQLVANHWAKQYDRIRKGEETYTELHQTQQGEIYESKPIAVTKDSEDEVSKFVEGSRNQLSRVESQLQSLATNHGTRVKEANDSIGEFEKSSFKQFEDGKLDALVNDTVTKIFHPVFHSNPLVKGYAKALLTIQSLGALVQKQGEELKGIKQPIGTEKKTEDKIKAGPNNNSMASVAPKVNGDDVNYEMFQEVMGNKR